MIFGCTVRTYHEYDETKVKLKEIFEENALMCTVKTNY